MLSASEASRFSSAYEDEIPRRRLGMTLRQTPHARAEASADQPVKGARKLATRNAKRENHQCVDSSAAVA
jgi:hypothetical protein